MTTKKYLFIQRSSSWQQQQQPSSAQMQEMRAVFNAWMEKFKANIVDLGGKLKPGGKILTTSGVTDGPFVEAKEVIGGFMIVSADSYEQALEVARECPGLMCPGRVSRSGRWGLPDNCKHRCPAAIIDVDLAAFAA